MTLADSPGHEPSKHLALADLLSVSEGERINARLWF